MYDIIVIGAGPAGLTSAIYAARAEKKVLVLEALNYGGQIINTLDIENYPVERHISGVEFATKIYNQAKDLGAEVKFEKVLEIKDNKNEKEVITSKNTYKGKSVIIATGNQNRKLGLENEDKFIGRGLSYCATCDGGFYKEKIVAVVGSGNSAIEDALYLTDIAKKVYLIMRSETFNAEEVTVRALKSKENIEFIYNSNIINLEGNEKLEKVTIKNKNDEIINLDLDGLFVAIGRIPENGNFAKLVELDKNGYIIANEDCHTNIPGIFVAGDTRNKEVRQLVTATSDGAIAATEAIKYINNL